MLDITKDNSSEFMKQLRKTHRPLVLTVKGKPAAVVQDATSYQRLLDIAASADSSEAIAKEACPTTLNCQTSGKCLIAGTHVPFAEKSSPAINESNCMQ